MCSSLQSVPESSSSIKPRQYTCGRSVQVEELLNLVAELSEKVGRLRSFRKSEKDLIGGVILYRPPLRQTHYPVITQETRVALLSCHQQKGGYLRDKGMEAGFYLV